MKAIFTSPQLCTLVKEPFDDKDWIFEEKFDGIRAIAIKRKGKVFLYSRSRKSLNKDFEEIVAALEKIKSPDFVIDGELVAFEGGVTNFSKLQMRKMEKIKVYFYVFDILNWDGKDLRKEPLIERKKWLKTHFSFGGLIRYTPHVRAKGVAYFKRASKKGLEGIIGKKADSSYLSKRTRNWQKFKCTGSQEFVIGGYTDPGGSREGFGALLIGYYDKSGLKYAGKVGTGYSDDLLKRLGSRLVKIERESCPFSTKPKEKKVHFVRPSIVCQVEFTEWTKDGKLRHPAFLGLRMDKPAKGVKREK